MSDLQPGEPGGPVDTVRDQDKIMLVLAYFGILGLIPLLTVKDSEYVRWHARQGMTLTVGVVVGQILVLAAGVIMGMIVHVFAAVFGCLNMVIGLAYFGLAIFCMMKAVNGERFRVPVIGDLAERLNI